MPEATLRVKGSVAKKVRWRQVQKTREGEKFTAAERRQAQVKEEGGGEGLGGGQEHGTRSESRRQDKRNQLLLEHIY